MSESDGDLDDEVSAITARSEDGEFKSGNSVVVIAGEASESEEEEEVYLSTNRSSVGECDAFPKTTKIVVREFIPEKIKDIHHAHKKESSKHKTLLHNKLRARNISLQNNLSSLINQPFQSATNEISNVTYQLIKTQMLIQELSPLLRQQTNDLFYLEDKIDFINDYSNVLPDIEIKENKH